MIFLLYTIYQSINVNCHSIPGGLLGTQQISSSMSSLVLEYGAHHPWRCWIRVLLGKSSTLRKSLPISVLHCLISIFMARFSLEDAVNGNSWTCCTFNILHHSKSWLTPCTQNLRMSVHSSSLSCWKDATSSLSILLSDMGLEFRLQRITW